MRNFDEAFAEKRKTGEEFILYGKKYQLPSSLPAKLALEITRASRDEKATEQIMIDLANSLFGKKNVEWWLNKGLTIEELEDLFSWAMNELTPSPPPKAPVNKG